MIENWTPEQIMAEYESYIDSDAELRKVFSAQKGVLGKFRALLKACARMFTDVMFSLVVNVYHSRFVSTSDRQALVLHLRDRGMEPWRIAAPARGKIRIGKQTQPSDKIEIPQGAIVSTSGASSEIIKQYVLLETGFIDANTEPDGSGYYTVEVPVEFRNCYLFNMDRRAIIL